MKKKMLQILEDLTLPLLLLIVLAIGLTGYQILANLKTGSDLTHVGGE